MPQYYTVAVTVGTNQQITVEPNPAVIEDPNVYLKFELQTTGYKFPTSNAVVVSSPGTQFPDASQTWESGLTVTLLDVNSQTGDYSYSVYVQPDTGGPLLRHDPTIRNEA